MHKAPRGIHQETMLQHTFRFLKVKESFDSFRLVSKTWKHAVETIRFDQQLNVYDSEIDHSYCPKYLQAFKKFDFTFDTGYQPPQLILNNMKKLNHLSFDSPDRYTFSPEDESFMFNIIQNSRQTLRYLRALTLQFSNLHFPNVEDLELANHVVTRENLENNFPEAMKNMENLRLVKFALFDNTYSIVCKYIAEKYPNHCISLDLAGMPPDILNLVKPKILSNVSAISHLENKSATHYIEYLHCLFAEADCLMAGGWDRYREILDQCTNLRAIEISTFLGSILDVLPTLPSHHVQVWNERMEYFSARGIEVVQANEIDENEQLKMKLAKEAGINWRFHLW